jgi:Fur family transcriptional regulator, peroxide stress response regulator
MDSDKRYRSIVDALRLKGIKLTPQRMEIIRILSHDTTHPSAGAILKKAREREPRMSTSTVYYTLGILKKEGLVKELEFYEIENRYESEMTDHIDLICTECGSITNLEEPVTITREFVRESTGFEAHRMRFEYYGICEECRNKKL